jgi:UDP-3-O-[3-hydroxymyristoyl] N-acetylglucosamine deacetylase
MAFPSQTTLAKAVFIDGAGLHSAAAASVVLRPAPAGRGVVFRRAGGGETPARRDMISATRLNTGLGTGAARVATVEHLMAAIALAGVDNILIDIDGPELPALDGSAAPWLDALLHAGLRPLEAPREAITITAPVAVEDAGRSIRGEPFAGRIVEVSIDFPDAAIGAQSVRLDLDDPCDVRRVARARTFCRLAEVEELRAGGLSLGGSFDNAVVVDGARVLNPSGLRDPDEFALHKALDLIGDLRLAGAPIIGRIIAHRPGHDLNARFLAALAAAGAGMAPDAAGPLRVTA